MKMSKSSVTSILWSAFCSIVSVLSGIIVVFFVLDAPVADKLVQALNTFVHLMLPDLSEQSFIFSLVPIVAHIGFAVVCAGGAYLANNNKLWLGAVIAAALTGISAATLNATAVVLTAVGGFGCMAGIVAYQFLTKKLPAVFNRETISYIVFGVMTTIVSFVSQMLFASLGTPATVNTIGSWVCAVIFAYVVNKLFVFESHTDTAKAFFRELWLFFAARLASLGMELVFMFVTVDWLGFSEPVCKLIAQVFILVANYIFSKLIIFRKKTE